MTTIPPKLTPEEKDRLLRDLKKRGTTVLPDSAPPPTPIWSDWTVSIPRAIILALVEGMGGSVTFTENETYMRNDEASNRLVYRTFTDESGQQVIRLELRDRADCGMAEPHKPHTYFNATGDVKTDENGNLDMSGLTITGPEKSCGGWR